MTAVTAWPFQSFQIDGRWHLNGGLSGACRVILVSRHIGGFGELSEGYNIDADSH